MAKSGDKVDPVTGLNERETKIMQTTWDLMTVDVVASGLDIMLSLFDAHPSYQSYFPAFQDVPRDELPTSKKLQAHGVKVVKALSEVIDGLTKTERFVSHLEGLGSRHSKRGIREEHFNNLTVVMVEVLRRNLGDTFTPEVEKTWSKAITGAWSHIFRGFDSKS